MPIEQFNYRRPANGAAEGVVPLSQAWGTRVHNTDRVGSAGTTVVPAGLYSTAPYVDSEGSHPSPVLLPTVSKVSHDTVPKCTAMRTDGTPCTMTAKNGLLCGPHTAQANRLKEKSD